MNCNISKKMIATLIIWQVGLCSAAAGLTVAQRMALKKQQQTPSVSDQPLQSPSQTPQPGPKMPPRPIPRMPARPTTSPESSVNPVAQASQALQKLADALSHEGYWRGSVTATNFPNFMSQFAVFIQRNPNWLKDSAPYVRYDEPDLFFYDNEHGTWRSLSTFVL